MQLLFDIGGTRMRIATSETISAPEITDTPQSYDEALKKIGSIARQLHSGVFEHVAGGIAGSLDTTRTSIVTAPHLPNWSSRNFGDDLKKIFDTEIRLENDTALIGLGESVFGAGKGYKIVGFLGVGTGVGGARIVDGKIDSSTFGFEPGHHIVNINNGKLQSLEMLVSGSALEARYGKKASLIDDPHIWTEAAESLGIGLYNLTLFWSPEVIVLGGGMMNSGRIPLEKVRDKLQHTMEIFPKIPELKLAELGESSGLFGAQALIGK